jgi:hypothetical protein
MARRPVSEERNYHPRSCENCKSLDSLKFTLSVGEQNTPNTGKKKKKKKKKTHTVFTHFNTLHEHSPVSIKYHKTLIKIVRFKILLKENDKFVRNYILCSVKRGHSGR